MADPANPERVVGVADILRRPGLRDVCGQSEPRSGCAFERPHERPEVGKQELVARDVEADNTGTGATGSGASNGSVRLLIVVAQCAHDDTGRDSGGPGAGCHAFADRGDHGIEVEPGARVRDRPEPELTEAAAVARGIDDRLVRDA